MPLDISVLVASGDQDVADYLSRRLLLLGCHATAVSRHSQAILASDARDIHLALVTEAMEDGSGLEVVAELRRRHPHLVVFLLVSTADEDLFVQARRRGATRCVVRPTNSVAVESLLEDAIESACPPAETASYGRDPMVVGQGMIHH